MAILDDKDFVEVEGRYYANPQTSLDESNAFIENLRDIQQTNNQQIQTDTYNLGTAVPSNLGGLTSPSGDVGLSYFTSRYQTPQTNAVVENLRAVAQAQALNQALQNEQERWKKRYQNAYRAAQTRAANRISGYGDPQLPSTTAGQGDTEKKATDTETIVEYGGSVRASDGQTLIIGPDGISRGYINGEYVELKPGQVYKPPLDLTPDNPLTPKNSLTPTNEIQRKNR